jgi:hypothetical protein
MTTSFSDTGCWAPLPTCTPPPAACSWPANLNPRLTEFPLFLRNTQKTAPAGWVSFSTFSPPTAPSSWAPWGEKKRREIKNQGKKLVTKLASFVSELSPRTALKIADSCRLPAAQLQRLPDQQARNRILGTLSKHRRNTGEGSWWETATSCSVPFQQRTQFSGLPFIESRAHSLSRPFSSAHHLLHLKQNFWRKEQGYLEVALLCRK